MKRPTPVELTAIDPRMFGKDWWSQPQEARYASIKACAAGLLVQVEMMPRRLHGDIGPCITWRGNSTQFMATQFFSKGITAKRNKGRYYTPDALRGHVYPDGDDRFVYVIESCCRYTTYHRRLKLARQALADETYCQFRDALINNGVSLLGNDTEEPL